MGTKAYGRLTVLAGAYLETNYCFTISPEVFIPQPKVKSAIIYFRKIDPQLVADDHYIKFRKIVTAACTQRSKMLNNSLKSWKIPEEVKEKIDFTRRPETLSIKEFAALV